MICSFERFKSKKHAQLKKKLQTINFHFVTPQKNRSQTNKQQQQQNAQTDRKTIELEAIRSNSVQLSKGFPRQISLVY